jgi:phosphotriesterase-related protein
MMGRQRKVQTVLGLISPEALGITLMHEHLLTDLSVFFIEPDEASAKEIAHQPLSLENLYYVKYNPTGNIDNLKLTDEKLIIKEAARFKLYGGSTIVEMSNIGLSRDPGGLARISRATGLNVIMGSGFYIAKSQKKEIIEKSIDELAAQIVGDIKTGFQNTGIKAGIIGEVGCNVPIDDFEKKSLSASAIAQQETGAMITIHSSHEDEYVLQDISILKSVGADLSRVVVSHVDFDNFSDRTIQLLLDDGCNIAYDTFSIEGYHPPYWEKHITLPTDEQRINSIIRLISDGYIEQVLIATDHCQKYHLASYGGGGYDHILRNVIPLMKIKGITDQQIQTILIDNPMRLLPLKN